MLECLLMGKPPPGVPPGDDAQEGAMRIFGVMRVLSDSLLFGKALTTLRKLLSGDDGDPPNHHPPNIPPTHNVRKTLNLATIASFNYLRVGIGILDTRNSHFSVQL